MEMFEYIENQRGAPLARAVHIIQERVRGGGRGARGGGRGAGGGRGGRGARGGQGGQ